jgi:nicotinate-nucleotide pyrophosphorylase (carboxylating)
MNTRDLYQFITAGELGSLLLSAIQEDQGGIGDISSQLLVSRSEVVNGAFVAREAGVMSGGKLLIILAEMYSLCAPGAMAGTPVKVKVEVAEGEKFAKGARLATIEGPYASLLGIERIALNFLCRLCGMATVTRSFVDAVRGTKAVILDSRKTIPGWRKLSKYAVVCGGGVSHRMGLFDAVLWKDNHIAHIPLLELASTVTKAINFAATNLSPRPNFFELEVDTLEQFAEVLRCPLDYVLLDNMSLDQLREAVRMRNDARPELLLEASGGVTLESVRAISETGVDRISVGALTHSAGIIDIGLDM